VNDERTGSEPSEAEEELRLEAEKVQDLDVPQETGEDVKGGYHTYSCECQTN
jgi:hypothetical protein